jgi:hypothetical protein
MAKKTIETSAAPHVLVNRIGSDLQVKGWDRPEILVKSSSDNNLVLEEQDGVVEVSSPEDCVLYIPHDASIEVKQTGNDARFRAIYGGITISQIGTDLAVRDVGPLSVEEVGTNFSGKGINGEVSIRKVGSSATLGDVGAVVFGTVGGQLVAKHVRGDLKIEEKVGGNAVIRDVDGQVMAKMIGGSFHLRDVGGGISADVGGNVTIEFSPVSWQAYDVKSGGDLRCHIPGDADATFEIFSGAQSIQIKTPTISTKLEEGDHSLTLGEGTTTVKLTAGGSVSIATRESDWEGIQDFDIDFGKEIGSMAEEIAEQATLQIESQLEMLEENLNVHLSGLATSLSSAGLSEERTQEIKERLERAKVHAAARAEAAAERAKVKLELRVAAVQRKAGRKARAAKVRAARKDRYSRGERGFTVMAAAHPKPVDPVSEEERMMILQMLEDKKIGVEQAEKLLAALEGKGS